MNAARASTKNLIIKLPYIDRTKACGLEERNALCVIKNATRLTKKRSKLPANKTLRLTPLFSNQFLLNAAIEEIAIKTPSNGVMDCNKVLFIVLFPAGFPE